MRRARVPVLSFLLPLGAMMAPLPAAGQQEAGEVVAIRDPVATRAFAAAQPSRQAEMRAVWIHSPFGIADWGWERTCQVLAEAGFNAIIANMLTAGSAAYPSDVLPLDERVGDRGDQLAALIGAARRHGIEVHVWKVNYNLYRASDDFVEQMRREGRLQADTKGEEVRWLCPSHPDNRALEVASMLEVVEKYDVDGIHFDYIRYPGVEGCYDDGCRRRFESASGEAVVDWPQDVLSTERAEAFQVWRQEQITALVRDVSAGSRRLKRQVKISAAVFSDWSVSRYTVGQDWVKWVRAGYLDFVVPMDYIPEPAAFAAMLRRQVDWVDGRIPLYAGIGVWQMDDPADVLAEVAASRRLGSDGFVLFQHSADLAQRILPLLRLGLTATATYPAHQAPTVAFEVLGRQVATGEEGVPLFAAGDTVTVRARLGGDVPEGRAGGTLSVRRLVDGLVVARAEGLEAGAGRRTLSFVPPSPGDYRVVATGDRGGTGGVEDSFVRRGPLVRVRSDAFLDSMAHADGLPPIPPTGTPVGIFAAAYGAAPILDALAAAGGLATFSVRGGITPKLLASTRVLVIPQPYNRWIFDASERRLLRDWVEEGGGLVVTHDMAGIRGVIPIVPEVCRRGIDHPRSTRWRRVADHPALDGVPEGVQEHTYYDHITLEPGPLGQVLATGKGGEPVLVAGEFGQGRYAALGLVPGLGPDDEDVPLTGAERQLVESLVRWAAAGSRR